MLASFCDSLSRLLGILVEIPSKKFAEKWMDLSGPNRNALLLDFFLRTSDVHSSVSDDRALRYEIATGRRRSRRGTSRVTATPKGFSRNGPVG